ncbi:MAG: hypothetical protein JSU70_12145 [Phycisphaerales bacterium]|nr:MAG: hypothetical protein JSU70_12145 [Phycisphaerales bacterium]
MARRAYTKPEIAKMRRAFLKTMSCAAAAKICGCNVKTVAKYRDQEAWITQREVGELCRGGGQTTLTPDIATKLATGWSLHIENDDLCAIIGISPGQLRGWLQNNTQVTIVSSIPRLSADGIPLRDKSGRASVSRTMETVGLYDLRAREWANFEYTYIQRLDMDADRAEAEGDLNTAFKIRTWILSKRFPSRYGNHAIDVNVDTATQADIVNIDELDLPLETRKQILSSMRKAPRRQ